MNKTTSNNILIAGIEFITIQTLSHFLTQEGFGVSVAKNIMETLNFINSRKETLQPISLLITEEDFIKNAEKENLLKVNQFFATIPVVFIKSSRKGKSNVPGIYYMKEPFNIDHFIKSIKKILKTNIKAEYEKN